MTVLRTVDIKNGLRRVGDIVKTGETVIVPRPHNENLVILSEETYNRLEKAYRNAEKLENRNDY